MDYYPPSFSFQNLDACAKFLDDFPSSVDDLFFENPLNDNKQRLELDADMSPDEQSGEKDIQVMDPEGGASEVSIHEALSGKSTSSFSNASTEEKTGVHRTEDVKATRDNADQDTHFSGGEEVPTETLAEDKPVHQDIHLTMSQVKEAASSGASLEFRPVMDEEAGIEAGTEETADVQKMAEVQVTEDEKDLSQIAHQDEAAERSNIRLAPVQNGETVQEHEAAMEEASEQRATQGGSLTQKDCILQSDVEMSGTEATASNSAEQNHRAALLKDTDRECTAVADVEIVCQDPCPGSEERSNGVREKPKASNDETDNTMRLSGEVKDEDGKDGKVRKDLSGSKDNPILLDDNEESPSQPSNEPTIIDDDDEKPPSQLPYSTQPPFTPVRCKKRKRSSHRLATHSDKEGEPSTHASSRSVRRNQGKRKTEGMSLWAEPNFLQQTASDLDYAWERTQISWIKMNSLIKRVTGADKKLDAAVARTKAKMGIMYAELDDEEELNLNSAHKIEGYWRKVNKRLEELNLLYRREKDVVEKFSQALGQFVEQAGLYGCIQEYPDSIDRKDEKYDKDFRARRRSKVQHR